MKTLNDIIGVLSFVILLLGAFSMGGCKSDLSVLLPKEIKGWKADVEDRIYNPETLYDYIDGGAELYLSYGFRTVVSRTYSKPDQPDVVVDLFDMETSQNAFGVFSHARETVDETFGQGSQYTEGMLLFWKDRYFVSILAYPETVESKSAVFELSRNIEMAIPEEGSLPEILALLPQASLIRESIRYFHHHVWLNSYCFVADRNILHISENTDALLAKYGEQEEHYILLLVSYRKDKAAKRAYNDFVGYYLPHLSKERIVQIEDGTWTGCQLTGTLLTIVFNAPRKDQALQLIQAVYRNSHAWKKPLGTEEQPE